MQLTTAGATRRSCGERLDPTVPRPAGGFVRVRAAWLDRRPRPSVESTARLLEDVARSLRSGVSLDAALGEAAAAGSGPAHDAAARVVARLRRGDDLQRALATWSERPPERRGARAAPPASNRSGTGLAVAALALAAEQGGSRAWALDQVAATLHERASLDRELRALSSQALCSAAIIAAAPLAFAVLSATVDPRVVRFLVTPAGVLCLVVGVVLDLAGAAWMARLVRSSSCS